MLTARLALLVIVLVVAACGATPQSSVQPDGTEPSFTTTATPTSAPTVAPSGTLAATPTATAPASPAASPNIVGDDSCPLIDVRHLAAAVGMTNAFASVTITNALPSGDIADGGGSRASCGLQDVDRPDVFSSVSVYRGPWVCAGTCRDLLTLADFEARIAQYGAVATTEPVAGLGEAAYWIVGQGVGTDGRLEAFSPATYPIVGIDGSELAMTSDEWKAIAIGLLSEVLAQP